MNISKFTLAGAVFAATLMTAMPMTASAASDIKSATDCEFEGGSMTNVKGSDYCLVQIRPEEYAGAEYDGNQLGVVDCPGSKLNDGLFCMYPVTVANTAVVVAPTVESAVAEAEVAEEKTLTDEVVEIVKDEAEKAAKKETKKKAKKALGKVF